MLYIRARLDTLLKGPIPLFYLDNSEVLTTIPDPGGWFTPHYQDYFFIAGWAGMTAVADTKEVYFFNRSLRCYGMCPEEQVEHHVRLHNFSFRPINVSVNLVRKTCKD